MPYFDVVVVEGEFGIGKPEPAVFRHALAAVGRQPHEAWMVGDDLAKDIAGGDAAGLHTVWVDSRHEGLPEAPAAHPHRIETRRIIRQAVATPERIGDLAVQLFGPAHGVDLELPDRAPHQPVRIAP